MSIQTAILIKTSTALGAEVRWRSCNIFSTQDDAAATFVRISATVFAWKGTWRGAFVWWHCSPLCKPLLVKIGSRPRISEFSSLPKHCVCHMYRLGVSFVHLQNKSFKGPLMEASLRACRRWS